MKKGMHVRIVVGVNVNVNVNDVYTTRMTIAALVASIKSAPKTEEREMKRKAMF